MSETKRNCLHKDCGGVLQYSKEMEKKGRVGVFECQKCYSIFSIIKLKEKEFLVLVIDNHQRKKQ